MNALLCFAVALLSLGFNALATDDSASVLEQINLARVSPARYADALQQRMEGVRTREGSRVVDEALSFLRHASPLPPLSFSDAMATGALRHVEDQGRAGTFGHTGTDHSTPWDRMSGVGAWVGSAGENISYGYKDAATIVATLIVDDGVRGRGHRKNIFNRSFAVAGIACGPHARYGAMCVIDFAGGFVEGAAGPSARGTLASAWTRKGIERF